MHVRRTVSVLIINTKIFGVKYKHFVSISIISFFRNSTFLAELLNLFLENKLNKRHIAPVQNLNKMSKNVNLNLTFIL